MRALAALSTLLLISCTAPPSTDSRIHGVQVFAADTVTARIHVSVTGDLQLTMRGDNFVPRPDRSFLVSTPAIIEARRGVGTARITSVDSTTRIAVVPLGTPEDSIDAATVTGTIVRLTRVGREASDHHVVQLRP
jgi:hypothetical protein